jgi:hypothetical protein
MADLFKDFKGINVTLAVMARALIAGRIDCKTAGQMVVHLQTCSKLLWQIHRKGREGRKENQESPRICPDERRLSTSRLRNETEQAELRAIQTALPSVIARDIGEDSRVVVEAKMRPFPESRADCRHGRCRDGPWHEARAA